MIFCIPILSQVNSSLTLVQSMTLLIEDHPVPLVANMHYCDLLSPYRALEWIYIKSVVNGPHVR